MFHRLITTALSDATYKALIELTETEPAEGERRLTKSAAVRLAIARGLPLLRAERLSGR